jgi:hypothetical protein
MNGRTILALIVAPVVGGLTYGGWLASSFSGIPDPYRTGLWTQSIPGIVVGTVFELFFLLPLLYLLQRFRLSARLWFIGFGILIWFLLSIALLSLTQINWSECVASSFMFLVPGAALVIAFGSIVPRGEKA